MRHWKVIFIMIFLFAAPSAYADGVLLDGGQGIFHSTDSQAIFLRYQKDSSPLLGMKSSYTVAVGTWNGENHNNAVILAKGVWWELSGKKYLCFEPGGAYITETTKNLGTHLQFAFRVALGMRTDKYDLSVNFRHFSNGEGIFHWSETPNRSDNFITLQIGYLL